jgi:hypothetical protein
VNHGIEVRLQVDAFRKAVRGHEDAARSIRNPEFFNTFAALLSGDFASDDIDSAVRKLSLQGRADTFGGGNEPAENDGVEAVFEELFDLLAQLGELRVFAGLDGELGGLIEQGH